VCLSNATERRRSRCCSTGPRCPASASSAGSAPARERVALPPDHDKPSRVQPGASPAPPATLVAREPKGDARGTAGTRKRPLETGSRVDPEPWPVKLRGPTSTVGMAERGLRSMTILTLWTCAAAHSPVTPECDRDEFPRKATIFDHRAMDDRPRPA
jgi:hypothetical protein